MKTLKKTLASLANAELYAIESSRKTTTNAGTTMPVASYSCNSDENYDGDNIFYMVSANHYDGPYGEWNAIRANYISRWQYEASRNGYSTISVLYGDGADAPSHVVYEVNKTYTF